MDRSVDSIGSCSLDVDADSTDFSDTSGSLNFATPSSAKDITREFTSRIKERCQISQINCQQTTTLLDPSSGKINTIITTIESPDLSPVKKPSYLNLACCVNGYSNLTTYDSKLRQNINKSREVSPIRPSSNSFQYCKTIGNLLAPPVPMPVLHKSTESDTTMDDRNFNNTKNGHTTSHERGMDATDNASAGSYILSSKYTSTEIKQETKKSFIQQRVERLYGPGALAQGFYSPRKIKTLEKSNNCITQYSFSSFQKDISNSKQIKDMTNIENFENFENGEDLPVLRHLRPEFRAQLPIISPKRSHTKNSDFSPVLVNGSNKQHLNGNEESATRRQTDQANPTQENGFNSERSGDNVNMSETIKSVIEMKISYDCESVKDTRSNVASKELAEGDAKLTKVSESTQQDGNYFLQLLKTEQDRLLNLASQAEREIDLLSKSDVPEEIFGYLRSASGKARLLVSQKMKQFEGLCKNNINQLPNEKFPTTNEDLQGFWDMVKLQIHHVDSLFAEIELLRSNEWKKPVQDIPNPPSGSKLVKRPLNTKSATSSSAGMKSTTASGSTSKKSASSALSAQKREAQRKQLLELKRRNKMAISAEQQQANSNSVEIFVNENCS